MLPKIELIQELNKINLNLFHINRLQLSLNTHTDGLYKMDIFSPSNPYVNSAILINTAGAIPNFVYTVTICSIKLTVRVLESTGNQTVFRLLTAGGWGNMSELYPINTKISKFNLDTKYGY